MFGCTETATYRSDIDETDAEAGDTDKESDVEFAE